MVTTIEVLSLVISESTATALSVKIARRGDTEKDLFLYFEDLRKALETQQSDLSKASEAWAKKSINYRRYQQGFYIGFDAITTQLPDINSRCKITFKDLVEAGFDGEITHLLLLALRQQHQFYHPDRLNYRPINPGQTNQAFLSYLIKDSSEFYQLVNALGDQLNTAATTAFIAGLQDVTKSYLAKIRDETAYQACIKTRRLL